MNEPAEHEIQETIKLLQDRLADPRMSHAENSRVRHGYNKAADILAQNQRDYTGIEKLQTVQARAIAELAVDYLLGETTQQILVNVPLRAK